MDADGYVKDVRRDCNLGIYQSVPSGFHGPPQNIGNPRFEDAFISPDTSKPVGQVIRGESFDTKFNALAKEAKSMSPAGVAYESRAGGKFDVKSNTPGHIDKSYHGFMLDGAYMGLREIGNALAGYSAAPKGASQENFQKMSGGLQEWGLLGAVGVALGLEFGKAPNWGENDYQRTRNEWGYDKAQKDMKAEARSENSKSSDTDRKK